MTLREHTTALLMVAMYYWLLDDRLAADTCLRAAVQINQGDCP